MSLYNFIASDYILPTIEYTNQKIITVGQAKELNLPPPLDLKSWDDLDSNCEVFYYENEDVIEFIIREYNPLSDCDVYLYTQKKFVYDLIFSTKALPKLFDYLKENGLNKNLEIWTVWLGDLNSHKNIKHKNIELIDLNELKLKNSLEEASLFASTLKDYKIDYKHKQYYDKEGQTYCICIKG